MSIEMNENEEVQAALSDESVAEEELQESYEEEDELGTVDPPIEFRDDPIGWLLSYRERRVKVRIKKKTYYWLMLLGVFGAHRFYARQYVTGLIYVLLCWTGLSVANTIIDLVVMIPIQADEEGYIWI